MRSPLTDPSAQQLRHHAGADAGSHRSQPLHGSEPLLCPLRPLRLLLLLRYLKGLQPVSPAGTTAAAAAAVWGWLWQGEVLAGGRRASAGLLIGCPSHPQLDLFSARPPRAHAQPFAFPSWMEPCPSPLSSPTNTVAAGSGVDDGVLLPPPNQPFLLPSLPPSPPNHSTPSSS